MEELIFLSHSSSDNDFAKRLATDLAQQGVRVWVDVRDIPPSSDWNDSIQAALERASRILVVWSQASVKSTEVLGEVFEARANGKELIQVRLEQCKPPAKLDRLQSVDFQHGYEEGLQRLLAFLPIGRRSRRLTELAAVLPTNSHHSIPRLTEK